MPHNSQQIGIDGHFNCRSIYSRTQAALNKVTLCNSEFHARIILVKTIH